MIYNENGIIINNGYQLDVIINEGFSDIANKGLKTVHGWIRKLIDAVQNTIEYASRIKYSKIIDNIKRMDDNDFDKHLRTIWLSVSKYTESEGYGKWIENFNNVLNELKRNNTLSTEEINKILYEGKNKNEWFTNNSKNHNNSGKPDISKLKKIITNLQDFTKPLRKSYSELKVLNTNINKGMKINSEVMDIMHSYCINAISAYRIMSKVLIDLFKNNKNEEKLDNKSTKYHISKSFYENIEDGNTYLVRLEMASSIIEDPTFKTFREMEQITKNMKDLYDEHNGEDFNLDKSTWNDDYLILIRTKVVRNFSHERLNHLMDVVKYLRVDKKQNFQDSIETARKAGVDEDKILKSKDKIDNYFTS